MRGKLFTAAKAMRFDILPSMRPALYARETVDDLRHEAREDIPSMRPALYARETFMRVNARKTIISLQ